MYGGRERGTLSVVEPDREEHQVNLSNLTFHHTLFYNSQCYKSNVKVSQQKNSNNLCHNSRHSETC